MHLVELGRVVRLEFARAVKLAAELMQPRQVVAQQRELASGEKPSRGAVRSRARQQVEGERRAARPRSCWRQSAIRAKLSRPRELTRRAR